MKSNYIHCSNTNIHPSSLKLFETACFIAIIQVTWWHLKNYLSLVFCQSCVDKMNLIISYLNFRAITRRVHVFDDGVSWYSLFGKEVRTDKDIPQEHQVLWKLKLRCVSLFIALQLPHNLPKCNQTGLKNSHNKCNAKSAKLIQFFLSVYSWINF